MSQLKSYLGVAMAIGGSAVVVAGERPNVVMMIVDDLGAMDLSCAGSDLYETPHIDQLASESVNFAQAYTSYPRSVPARYSLMTGVNSARPMRGAKLDSRKFGGGQYTLATPFKESGYDTFYAGKWHLSSTVVMPEGNDFNTTIAAGSAGAPNSYFYPFSKDGGHPMMQIIATDDVQPKEHLSDYLSRKTAEYIESAAKSDQPFFAVCGYYAVHAPFQAKKAKIAYYRDKVQKMGLQEQPLVAEEGGATKTQQDFPIYAAMISSMDDGVGRIVDALKSSGVYDNTIIIVISDHGGLSNKGTKERALASTNAPLRAGKGHLYEGGVRIPLLIRMPNQSESIEVSEPVVNYDIFPTLLDLCSLQMSAKKSFDGVTLRAAIESGKQSDLKKRDLFWHKEDERVDATGDYISSSVLSGNYKLIDFYGQSRVELYDLSKDLSETKNLVGSKPEVAKRLMDKLNAWREECKVGMGKPTTDGKERKERY